jgi:hypothetical protein
MHEVVVHKTVTRDCEKRGDASLPCSTMAQWVKLFSEGRMPFRTTQCWQPHNSACCFIAGCRSSMGWAGVSCWRRCMSQNRAPHSARYCWIPQNCSALGTPYNVRGATMATLCNCTGLVGPVPEVLPDHFSCHALGDISFVAALLPFALLCLPYLLLPPSL